jgi:hypothetical protein
MEPQVSPKAEQPRKGSRALRIIRRIFITLITSIVLLIGTGILLAWIYEDDIKAIALKKLEKHLNTELIIDPANIDLSLIRDFPLASLEFRDIKALDAIVSERKDTLMKASSIGFQFNIIDIFMKNYRIRKVAVSDVKMKLWVDKRGKDNYHFLKPARDTASSEVSFELEKFVLKNVEVSYIDHRSRDDYSFIVKEASLNGHFSNDRYTLETKSAMHIHYLHADTTFRLSNNPLNIELELDVDNTINTYTIRSSEVKLSDLVLDITGHVKTVGKAHDLDLAIKGKDLDIRSILSLLPSRYKAKVNDYESSGQMYLSGTVKGPVSATGSPVVKMDFGIDKGTITQLTTNVTLNNVNLKGSFANGYTDKPEKNYLEIAQLTAQVADGSLDGRFKIRNFNDPTVDASANASLELSYLQKFLDIDTIETLNGKLKLNASFNGKIKNPKAYLEDDFDNAKTTGQMTVKDATLRLKNNHLKFDSLNAYFIFNNNDIDINSFSGNISGNDFSLRGVFKNVLAYLFIEKRDLDIDAVFRSSFIDLAVFLKDKTEGSPKTADYKVQFSEHINFNLKSEIGQLKLGNFEAKNIKGTVILKNKKLIADPLTMQTFGGAVQLSGMVDGTKPDMILVTCDAKISKINISQLFHETNNFGQTYFTDKHLRGITSGEVQLASVWSPELEIDYNKLYARSHFVIENGELIGFEPLMELPAYMRKDKTLFFLKVDELEKRLKHIKFARLENDIEIRNQVITIPKMTIKSSATDMDMEFSGTHTFDNKIDYRFYLLIRELLIRKEDQIAKSNTEFGIVEDDGHYNFPLYLRMVGTTEKFEIKRDKEGMKEKRQEKIKKEKENLKTILREEFGWFKKDTVKGKKDEENNDKFIIKWNEEKHEKKDERKKKKEENLEGDDF